MAERTGGSSGNVKIAETKAPRGEGIVGEGGREASSASASAERRGSRRVSRSSTRTEDYANLDEYGKLVKYISTFRDKGDEGGEENFEEKRVWYAPWKKRKVYLKTQEEPGKYPEDWLVTDISQGLPSSEIQHRRRQSGWNELVSEKENPIAKIISYFRGPILYGMCWPPSIGR